MDSGSMYFEANRLAYNGATAVQYGVTSSGIRVACDSVNAMPIVFGGMLYTAQVGINYRKLKKGKMTETQF